MTIRIGPSGPSQPLLPADNKSPQRGTGAFVPEGSSSEQVSPSVSMTGTQSWASASGYELYKRVQALPEGADTGSAEPTPKSNAKARQSGVGRNVDTWA